MVEFVNEPVDVEIRVRSNGTGRPLAFVWRGRRYEVESWGREAHEEREGRAVRCHLVQTAGAGTWELCRDAETGVWTLTRRWPPERRLA